MKYNWKIIGHDKEVARLEEDLASGNTAHAYLLAGPHSIGKATVAKKMAGILQCEEDFCHSCSACLQVEKGSHVDTIVLKDSGESIKIEMVRKIAERVNMTRQSRHKVFILQGIERMTLAAANSFLKILEEPPEGTIFILTTNNLGAVLPTIVSRVRVLKFNSSPIGYLEKKLCEQHKGCDVEEVHKVALFSLGKAGKAVDMMASPETRAEYMEMYHDVQDFLSHERMADRFLYVEKLISGEKNMNLFFEMLMHVLRSKMLEGEGNRKKTAEVLEEVENMPSLVGSEMCIRDRSCTMLDKNINSRLVLENLMLTL